MFPHALRRLFQREWKCAQSCLGCSREQNPRHTIGYLTLSWDFRNRECSRNNLRGFTLVIKHISGINSLILSSLLLLTCLMMLNPRRAALLATDLVNGVARFGNSLSSPFGFLKDALQLLRSLPEKKRKTFSQPLNIYSETYREVQFLPYGVSYAFEPGQSFCPWLRVQKQWFVFARYLPLSKTEFQKWWIHKQKKPR